MERETVTVKVFFDEKPEECMNTLKKSIRKMEKARTKEEFSDAYSEAQRTLPGVYRISNGLPHKRAVCGRF